MTIRTTVAFDPATVARWERLTKRWGVSKSETLRRALEAAECSSAAPASSPEPNFTGMTPAQILDWMRANPAPRVPGGWGSDSQSELRAMRDQDAALEEAREHERTFSAKSRTTLKNDA